MLSRAWAWAIVLSSTTAPNSALSEEAPQARNLSVEALVGYGLNERYGAGVGARVGYTLPIRIFVGTSFAYHFGITNATPYGDSTSRVWLTGGEAGYDVPTGPIVVRPYLGLGLGEYTSTRCIPPIAGAVGCAESTNARFALWPGVTVLLPLEALRLGVDARFEALLQESYVSTLALYGTAGLRF